MTDPRWNPAVVKAMDETVQAEKKANPVSDTFLLSVTRELWGSYYEDSGYAGTYANDRIPKVIKDHFDEPKFAESWVKDRNSSYFFNGSVDNDYELIERVDFEANEYQAQKTYKLFKTKSGRYFIVRSSTKTQVMADRLTILAADAGAGNWSGCWRHPLI